VPRPINVLVENVTSAAARWSRDLELGFEGFGFARVSVAARERDQTMEEFVSDAVRCWLGGRPFQSLRWLVPGFRRNDKSSGPGTWVTLSLNRADWRALESESRRQGVGVERLVHHAAIWLLAEIDAAFERTSG
jgi:hypothetical protein